MRAGHDDEQQELLARIRAMRAEGQSVRKVCTWLNEHAVLTPRGAARWFPNTLHRALHSEAAVDLSA